MNPCAPFAHRPSHWEPLKGRRGGVSRPLCFLEDVDLKGFWFQVLALAVPAGFVFDDYLIRVVVVGFGEEVGNVSKKFFRIFTVLTM